MLPIGDQDEPGGLPIVNIAIIAINVLVFVLLQLPSDAFTMGFSTIPKEITTGVDLVGPVAITLSDGTVETIVEAPGPNPIWLTLFTSMFMHGGWAHLGGNMLFLFIFGDNVERRLGSLLYVAFYVVCGVVASASQIATDPNSVIPSLGASGAISGVLAAYLVYFPQNRVRVLVGFPRPAVALRTSRISADSSRASCSRSCSVPSAAAPRSHSPPRSGAA